MKRNKKKSPNGVFLMVMCTFFLAVAQIFMKVAGTSISLSVSGLLFNWWLWAAIITAGFGAVLMTIAFGKGELSTLFPFVGLTFIWTLLIAVFMFGEIASPFVLIGVACIIIGVMVLGRGQEVHT